jgi:hypothetical protein
MEERKFSATIFISALDGGDRLTPSPALAQRKLSPLDRRVGGPQSRPGRCEVERNFLNLMGIEYWWESQKERDHWEDQDVDGWTILKWILER